MVKDYASGEYREVPQRTILMAAVAVLASGRMGYMTGHALVVDGGGTAV